jgi:integrase/recombinase XerD
MTSTRALMAPHVQAFFTGHLCHQKRVSPQTIARCRDTFRLLLTFVHETVGIAPSALCVPDLDAPTILAFLDYLAHHRGNTVRSRNIRLSALRTFFRCVALRDPESLTIATRV